MLLSGGGHDLAPASSWGCVHCGASVLFGFIYRHDKTCGFRGCSQALVRTIAGSHTEASKLLALSSLLMSTPYHVMPLGTLSPQHVEDVCGVKASIVTQLAWDNF